MAKKSVQNGGRVTTEEFMTVHDNRVLRSYVARAARRRSRKPENQEDMMQEAWLVISTAPPGCATAFYCRLAASAIFSSYWQMNKERLLANKS